MNTSKYLLLLDPREDSLSLHETALRTFYGGEVMTMKDSSLAMNLFKTKGHPEMLIMDSEIITNSNSLFYEELQNQKFSFPIIAMTSNKIQLESQFPSITAAIEKPINSTSFSYLVKSLTTIPTYEPEYVPIKVSVLLRLGMGHFDLYLKLSDKNFVKILHRGEPFLESDGKKLDGKGISDLFIKKEDAPPFLKILENSFFGENSSSEESISLILEHVESLERVAKYMNWGPSVLVSAQKSVEQAVGIISKNPSIVRVLKKKLEQRGNAYSQHIGLLTYLVCAFSSSIGWIGESGQVKLAMAAILHDAAVDETIYGNIAEWNKKASNPNDKELEIIKYRMHPFEASKLLKSLDTVSTDVDQIILQHHEKKDGTGFPRGLDATRIGLLPSVFIIVEDMVDFIGDGENLETSLTDFITWGREYYNTGHFQKIFVSFDEKLKKN